MPSSQPTASERIEQEYARNALEIINKLMSPNYVLDVTEREQVYLLQQYFLDQLQGTAK